MYSFAIYRYRLTMMRNSRTRSKKQRILNQIDEWLLQSAFNLLCTWLSWNEIRTATDKEFYTWFGMGHGISIQHSSLEDFDSFVLGLERLVGRIQIGSSTYRITIKSCTAFTTCGIGHFVASICRFLIHHGLSRNGKRISRY